VYERLSFSRIKYIYTWLLVAFCISLSLFINVLNCSAKLEPFAVLRRVHCPLLGSISARLYFLRTLLSIREDSNLQLSLFLLSVAGLFHNRISSHRQVFLVTVYPSPYISSFLRGTVSVNLSFTISLSMFSCVLRVCFYP
jgi:hypothetical protein